ncbi:hypothetical protein LZ554_007528 [Drepanopeziza brunnea f. sp. 'monogermtubi']|nr:hypothetical protein LZ554_007528 [Drepanopeziza brunnea f. sp. 'monogermtubi']
MSGMTEVKRRSGRVYTEEENASGSKNAEVDARLRAKSIEEIELKNSESRNSSKESKTRQSMVDIGKDINIFPTTEEDIEKHITQSLEAAKASKAKEEARPTNLGVVIPGKIYRSSWPTDEDFLYLEALGLKTVLSLVQNDFSPAFKDFVKKNDIAHKIINMPGTKKVAITKELMQSIMEIALDESSYPLLIHCNHGKHRTGCVVGVIRHVARWDVESIVEEYRGYADPKVRDCDVAYITDYQASSLHGLFVKETTMKGQRPTVSEQPNEGQSPPAAPLEYNPFGHDIHLGRDQEDRANLPLQRRRMGRYLLASAFALGVWFTTGFYWHSHNWKWEPLP